MTEISDRFLGIELENNADEVRTISGNVKYSGQMTSYDDKNGFITVTTAEGASIAHLGEAFVKA